MDDFGRGGGGGGHGGGGGGRGMGHMARSGAPPGSVIPRAGSGGGGGHPGHGGHGGHGGRGRWWGGGGGWGWGWGGPWYGVMYDDPDIECLDREDPSVFNDCQTNDGQDYDDGSIDLDDLADDDGDDTGLRF
jgi:hypothetical protein